MANASETSGSGAGTHAGLPVEVQTFARMIQELEEQLDRMLATNDALAKDLADERARRATAEGTVEELEQRLRREERDADARENLRAEINHLTHERSKLIVTVREIDQKLSDAQRENQRQTALIERLRAARSDALEDVKTVEAQFEHAMRLVGDARAQLTVLKEERDALEGRVAVLEAKLAEVRQEREALVEEVDQSRDALDEVRRALADALASSTVFDDKSAS
jgi:chromosome segregation ATPase